MTQRIHATIAKQFHQWKDLTYPGVPLDPKSEQYKQLRFAFFGGAASLLVEMMALADHPDEEGVAALNRYQDEITGFLQSEKDNHIKSHGHQNR